MDESQAYLAAPEWSSRAAIIANVAAHIVAAGPMLLYRLIVPAIMERYQVSSVEVGYLFSLGAVCTGVCAILVGIFASKMNFRRVCSLAMAIHVVGALICLFAPSFAVFVLGRAISACSDGVLICAANAALARSSKPTRNWTYCAVAVGLFGAVGNAIVGRMLPIYGMDSVFVVVAILGIVVLPSQMFIPNLRPPKSYKPAKTVREQPFKAVVTALKGPKGALMMSMIVLFTMGSGMLSPFDAVIGLNIGLSIVEIGDIRGIAFAAATGALFINLFLSDRFGRAAPFLITGLMVALSDGVIGMTDTAMIFAIAIIVGDAGHRLNGPYYASVLARHDRTGSLNGAAIAFVNVGSALGPVLGGHLHEATGSFHAVGLAAMVLGLIGFGVMSIVAFKQERGGEEQQGSGTMRVAEAKAD